MAIEQDELLRQLLDERHEQTMSLLREVRDKVAQQNGRVGKLESTVAVLQDRSPGRAGMMAGGAVAGGVAIIVKLIEALAR
jgi:hypothetical protein